MNRKEDLEKQLSLLLNEYDMITKTLREVFEKGRSY